MTTVTLDNRPPSNPNLNPENFRLRLLNPDTDRLEFLRILRGFRPLTLGSIKEGKEGEGLA